MSTQNKLRCSCRGAMALALVLAVVLTPLSARAQSGKINLRPLTPQEIVNYGLTNTTQKSCGSPNVAIAQQFSIGSPFRAG